MKTFSNGIDQKNIISVFSPSRIFAFINVCTLVLLSILSTVISMYFFPIFIFAGIAFAFLSWYRYMYIIFTSYTLTAETLTVRTGVVARSYNNLELYRVKDYLITQSALERIFGIMTVKLITTDTTNPELLLQGIPVSNITETIRDLVQKARLNNRIFEIN